MESTQNLGDKLRELRLARGWTEGQVAIRARLKRSYINLVETGRIKKPSAEKLLKLATAFNIDPDVLHHAAGYPVPIAPRDLTLPPPVDYFRRYYGVDEATALVMRNVAEIVYTAWEATHRQTA